MSIKRALGRLECPDDLAEAIETSGFDELPITIAHAELAGALPPHHADPFDRLLVSQARLHDLILVTRDEAFAPYGIRLLAA